MDIQHFVQKCNPWTPAEISVQLWTAAKNEISFHFLHIFFILQFFQAKYLVICNTVANHHILQTLLTKQIALK